MYSPRLVTTLNNIASDYQPLMHRAIVDVLSQAKFANTGFSAESVKVEVVAGDESKAPALMITFADYLIILNQRKVEWTKLPNIGNLLEWADTKRSTRVEAEKLAFAVAWDKRKNDTWKPKPWRKKSLSQVLKDMNEELLKQYDEAIEADLVEATKGN
jgi:hypothetical protein